MQNKAQSKRLKTSLHPLSLLKHLSVIYKQQQLANNIDITLSMNDNFE